MSQEIVLIADMFSSSSTFKVELDECSKILREAGPRSFVILDGASRSSRPHHEADPQSLDEVPRPTTVWPSLELSCIIWPRIRYRWHSSL